MTLVGKELSGLVCPVVSGSLLFISETVGV